MVKIIHYQENITDPEPKRLIKFLLFWCKKGQSHIKIDDHTFILDTHQLTTITSGQYHQVTQVSGKLICLEFTLDFFSKNDNDIELVFHNGLFCHFGMNEVILIQNYALIDDLLQKIENELDQKPYQYLISLHSYIELLLVEVNRSKIKNGDEIWKPDALFLNFLELVRAHYGQNYPVSHFAGMLHTTQTKLNELSKLHTNKTVQNVMYSLVITEAKRLLLYTTFSIKEIAYQLGFNDPFYFSNFFKKHTKISPIDYRKEVSK